MEHAAVMDGDEGEKNERDGEVGQRMINQFKDLDLDAWVGRLRRLHDRQ